MFLVLMIDVVILKFLRMKLEILCIIVWIWGLLRMELQKDSQIFYVCPRGKMDSYHQILSNRGSCSWNQ